MRPYEVQPSAAPRMPWVESQETRIVNTHKKESHYIPALNQTWLTPLYDPVLKWGMREENFKRYLVGAVQLSPGDKVLDLGCGTGTLTVMLKRSQPFAQVIGLDGDLQVLEIARRKALAGQAEIQWEKGLAYETPHAPNTFDRVISSLMVHHLTSENKARAFREIYRILTPGAEAHLLDFGQPHGLVMSIISVFMSNLEEGKDNIRGRIPGMLAEAGFSEVEIPRRFKTIFGEIYHYKVMKPR